MSLLGSTDSPCPSAPALAMMISVDAFPFECQGCGTKARHYDNWLSTGCCSSECAKLIDARKRLGPPARDFEIHMNGVRLKPGDEYQPVDVDLSNAPLTFSVKAEPADIIAVCDFSDDGSDAGV